MNAGEGVSRLEPTLKGKSHEEAKKNLQFFIRKRLIDKIVNQKVKKILKKKKGKTFKNLQKKHSTFDEEERRKS